MHDPENRSRTRIKRALGVGLGVLLVVAWLVSGGIGQLEKRGYETFVHALNEKSELKISTYPAWFPREEVDIPFVYTRRVSADSVFFQVFIREAGRTAGRTPHNEFVTIHSFAYRFGNGPRTELLRDYEDGFWMQGDDRYSATSLGVPALLYFKETPVTVEIDLTLNGQTYTVEGEMPSYERATFYPRVLDLLR